MGRHLRQNELLKRPPMLSNHGLGGPVLRHGFDLIADISISAMHRNGSRPASEVTLEQWNSSLSGVHEGRLSAGKVTNGTHLG
jgi:hypothetical protein